MSNRINCDDRLPTDDRGYLVLFGAVDNLKNAVAYSDSEDCEMVWRSYMDDQIIKNVKFWIDDPIPCI